MISCDFTDFTWKYVVPFCELRPFPSHMLATARFVPQYFTQDMASVQAPPDMGHRCPFPIGWVIHRGGCLAHDRWYTKLAPLFLPKGHYCFGQTRSHLPIHFDIDTGKHDGEFRLVQDQSADSRTAGSSEKWMLAACVGAWYSTGST